MVHLYGAVGHDEYTINDAANIPDAEVLNAGANWSYYYSDEVSVSGSSSPSSKCVIERVASVVAKADESIATSHPSELY